MIKNIVFDMGRVLLDYDAVRVCWQYTDSSEDVELMSRELFFAEEWVLLDRGTITEEEALRRVQKRLPDERTREMARLCLAHWHEFNIEPKPGMRELVMQIKEAGCAVYLCSNASHRLRVFEKEIPGNRSRRYSGVCLRSSRYFRRNHFLSTIYRLILTGQRPAA